MTRRHAAVAMIAIVPMLTGAAPRLVPDAAPRTISIHSGFNGAQLLLFGAILYPRGVAPDDRVDVVVVVKGPPQSVTVREKAKVAGIWINAARADFRSVPGFYAVASTRPLRTIVDARTAAIWEFGIDNIWLSPIDTTDSAKLARFKAGMAELNQRHHLYVEEDGAVELTDRVLYRATIDIPARAPIGRYTAETFLVRDGRVVAAATRDITIDKTGFERFVAIVARRNRLAYGAAAVLLSLCFGWMAGQLLRRR